jgi:hypothetical protein
MEERIQEYARLGRAPKILLKEIDPSAHPRRNGFSVSLAKAKVYGHCLCTAIWKKDATAQGTRIAPGPFVYKKRTISIDFGLLVTIGCEASHGERYVFLCLQTDHKIQPFSAINSRIVTWPDVRLVIVKRRTVFAKGIAATFGHRTQRRPA